MSGGVGGSRRAIAVTRPDRARASAVSKASRLTLLTEAFSKCPNCRPRVNLGLACAFWSNGNSQPITGNGDYGLRQFGSCFLNDRFFAAAQLRREMSEQKFSDFPGREIPKEFARWEMRQFADQKVHRVGELKPEIRRAAQVS